jgi:formylglycine-generating enzyme required for sulfatase activity
LGIYDMSGNVWEWCSDWYGSSYYSSSPQTNPTGASSGSYHVYRGGSWSISAQIMRVPSRDYYAPDDRYRNRGFRLACSSKEENTQQAVDIRMISVPGGTFTMGCTGEQVGDCYGWEKPAHQVTVSSFSIGKYEVTQAQWVAVMGSNPSKFQGDNLPVETVSWVDVQEFIRKLNAKTGKNYRLPTEAEWEYAARGGAQSMGYKYSGSNTVDDVAWYDDNSGSSTHTVGTKQPNELGIYDMSGNVYEWCSDWYGDYSSSSQTNPTGASSGSARVGRGGGWDFFAQYVRVPFRLNNAPDFRRSNIGFRLASSSK